VCAAILGLAGPSSLGAEKVTLKHKFRKGPVTRLVTTIDMAIEMTMPDVGLPEMPKDMKVNTTQTYEMLYRVSDAEPNGNTTIEITFDRFKQAIDMNETKMEFDSKDPDRDKDNPLAKPLSSVFKSLIGCKYTVRLDKDGRVAEVKGLDEIWNTLGEGKTPQAVRDEMRKMFGDKQLNKMMSDFMGKDLPPHPVAIGESWTLDERLDVPMFGGVQTKTTCTLVAVEERKGKRCAKIGVVGTMKSTETQPVSKPRGFMPSMRIRKSDMQGFEWFDIEAGQFLEMDMDQTMEMTMGLPGPPGGGEPSASQPTSRMSIEQRMQGKTRIVAVPEPAEPGSKPE